ncbi:hypothetical protein PDJAM_G00115530 [Pangasius djambal]|uniref:Uncharacterized protein n=1 Tax=Pangasius djambal TaxID=1691987 RepID=A0ACC5Z7Y0_9TELE|nr:hypothetical protein [Pangasius djambal]
MKMTTTTLMVPLTTSNRGHPTHTPTHRLRLLPRASLCSHMHPFLNSKPPTHTPSIPNILNPSLRTLILNRHLIRHTPNIPSRLAPTNTHPGPNSPTHSTSILVPLLSNTCSTLSTGHRPSRAPTPNTLNTPNTPNTPTTLLMSLLTGRTFVIQPPTTVSPPVGRLTQDTDPLQIRMMRRAFGHNHFQTKAVLIFYRTDASAGALHTEEEEQEGCECVRPVCRLTPKQMREEIRMDGYAGLDVGDSNEAGA